MIGRRSDFFYLLFFLREIYIQRLLPGRYFAQLLFTGCRIPSDCVPELSFIFRAPIEPLSRVVCNSSSPANTMGVLDFIRGRDDARLRSAAAEPGSAEPKQYESGVAPDHSASDSDTLSLEARNEKDIQEHPNEVTKDAYSGVQKAEAAALVWSRKALYMTYAWYVGTVDKFRGVEDKKGD